MSAAGGIGICALQEVAIFNAADRVTIAVCNRARDRAAGRVRRSTDGNDLAGVIAVLYDRRCSVVGNAHDACCTARASDRAGVIAIRNRRALQHTSDTAYAAVTLLCNCHSTGIEAAGNWARRRTGDTADLCNVGRRILVRAGPIAADRTIVGAVGDMTGRIEPPDDAADDRPFCGDGHMADAALKRAIGLIADTALRGRILVVCSVIAAVDRDVFDQSAFAGIAEERGGQTVDGLAIAVEGAGVHMAVVADGGSRCCWSGRS